MIKKTYQKPTMKMVKIRQRQLLCSSPATLNSPKTLSTSLEYTDWYELE